MDDKWIKHPVYTEQQFLRRSTLYIKYIPTNDNWCGSFNGNYVCVRIMKLSDNIYRIVISGNDDAMIGFETYDKEFALWLYNDIDHFDYKDQIRYINLDKVVYIDRN